MQKKISASFKTRRKRLKRAVFEDPEGSGGPDASAAAPAFYTEQIFLIFLRTVFKPLYLLRREARHGRNKGNIQFFLKHA